MEALVGAVVSSPHRERKTPLHPNKGCNPLDPRGIDALRNTKSRQIGGMRPRFHMQGVLFFMPSQWRIDPGDIGDRGAAERTGKPLRPNRVAGIARAVS